MRKVFFPAFVFFVPFLVAFAVWHGGSTLTNSRDWSGWVGPAAVTSVLRTEVVR